MLRQLARTAGKAAQRPLARSLATQALSRPALRSPRTPSSPSVLMRTSTLSRLATALAGLVLTRKMTGQASSTTPHSSTVDPQESAAQQALDEGTEALSRGDLETAKKAYERSVGIKQTSVGALRERGRIAGLESS